MAKRLLCVIALWMAGAMAARADVLCTKEDALASILGKDAKITAETRDLTPAQLSAAKERLGGSLVHHRDKAAAPDESKASVEFDFATKDGKRTGVAIQDTEPGKWGPVAFMVGLDPQGKVTKVIVLSYVEKRGRPIARASWMSQFTGKTSKDPLTVGKDIVSVSGATISSSAAAFAVKKAIVLYEEVYLKK
jgi:Na+-translocating ferredoxin:NAD+ oxidoreductase RnfG subunit